MKKTAPVEPFDSRRRIGTIFDVGASSARAVLSDPASDSAEVGAFVVIKCAELVMFGRITEVHSLQASESEPGGRLEGGFVAAIELLTTMALDGDGAYRGIARFPHIGNPVYSAPPELLSWLFECSQIQELGSEPVMLNLTSLTDGTEIGLTPERLFGRHCAVLGATGAGKSWTFARLVEEAARYSSKMILFDATGEFHTLSAGVRHVHIGSDPAEPESTAEVAVPYQTLTESDLFALFKPSGPTQAPKLRAAIKSLKLARVPQLATRGVVLKAGKLKAPFETAYAARAREIEDPRANFEISALPAQIDAECVFPSGGFSSNPDPSRWGAPNEIERSNCVTLITRIEDMLQAPELACIFQPGDTKAIFDEIESFIDDRSERVLHVSLKHLPFAHDAREIVVNALGRHLLGLGRGGKFRDRPLLLLLDEAHHFLNKTLGDENTRYPLDSFELIAKEGRKLSLNIAIATQRPRDIPEGILSQMGTLIIHRLNNDRDREVVERASSEADRSAMAFVPGLGDGQAVIIGVDFPIPLAVQITKPEQKPDSRGPDYQAHWR
jgi:uncharacterized protein